MRAPAALLLATALLAGAGSLRAEEPQSDGSDHALQMEMDRLYALRTVDPQAFVAQTRSLEALPAPTNVAQREFRQFLAANRRSLEGRFAEAIALAKSLSESAEDPKLRLMTATFIVNMRAGLRDFETGLRELSWLLAAHPHSSGELGEETLALWSTAAIFYAELERPELSAWYANRVLETQHSDRQRCIAKHYVARSREALRDDNLSTADYDETYAACRRAGDAIFHGLTHISHARFLRDRDRLGDALALMAERLGAIESARYPRLVAEAYALDAELLFAAGRFDDAERQARRAVQLSQDLPTGLPAAMAEKVLYDIARGRGDAGAALRHLQNHVAASQMLAEERRIKERAFRTVQHEQRQRAQALQVAGEHHRVLDLEAQVAKAESRNALLAVALLAATLFGFGTWAWRLLLRQRHVRALSQTDALTGFSNRQHFSAEAEAALARSRRSGQPVALATFDLDHFKRINDLHGHLAGDAALRTVAAAVHAVPVEPGITRRVGRMGGEEFALLLEAATPAAALAHAEACRAAIAAARTTLDSGVVLAVTASFGLAGTASIGHRLHDLLAASDRALYVAKAEGRDRIGVADAAPVRDAA